jgi:hypothetical protein
VAYERVKPTILLYYLVSLHTYVAFLHHNLYHHLFHSIFHLLVMSGTRKGGKKKHKTDQTKHRLAGMRNASTTNGKAY